MFEHIERIKSQWRENDRKQFSEKDEGKEIEGHRRKESWESLDGKV